MEPRKSKEQSIKSWQKCSIRGYFVRISSKRTGPKSLSLCLSLVYAHGALAQQHAGTKAWPRTAHPRPSSPSPLSLLRPSVLAPQISPPHDRSAVRPNYPSHLSLSLSRSSSLLVLSLSLSLAHGKNKRTMIKDWNWIENVFPLEWNLG